LSVERSALNVERSASSSVDADNPWPGLASFTEEARAFFFGREKETEELVRLIRRNTLTVLFGQSGLGKSSLLQAGAFPQLREADFLPLYLRLDHGPNAQRSTFNTQRSTLNCRARPLEHSDATAWAAPLVDQVKTALVDAFKSVGADAPAPRADETLWEYFHRKDIDILSAKNRLLTPVLAFDQFEEIFTLGRASEAARERGRAFLAELADLVENRAPAALRAKFDSGELDIARYNFDKPSCQVVLSLREDFLPDLEGLKHEMRSILHSRMRVKRLNGTQALEIVTRPAPQLLAEGVAERVVEFVAGARGGSVERLAELEVEPALLSVICRELNERRRTLHQPQITADLVSGNRREILTDFYERSVADLPEAMRRFVEDHLLTKSGFRDNLALETALEFPGVTRPLIDTLVGRRLVRIEDRLGVQRVELTHDVLAEVIRASRDSRQQRIALEEARQRELLAVAAVRRQTRRQRFIIGGLAAAVVALLIGAFFGIRAQRRAEKTARDKSAEASRTDFIFGSRLLLEENKTPEGLAYLVRAARSDPSNRLVGPRLISSLAYRSFAEPVGIPFRSASPITLARYADEGRRIVSSSKNGQRQIWDVATGRAAQTVNSDSQSASNSLVFSSDGSRTVTISADRKSVTVWSLDSGKPLYPPLKHEAQLARANLSPDNRWLVTVTLNDQARVWDAATGELKAALAWPGSIGLFGFLAFSPDGSRVVFLGNGFQIWPLPTGAALSPLLPINSARGNGDGGLFSPDGTLLAITDGQGAQFYDGVTGSPVGPRMTHGGQAHRAAFSKDGRKFVTGSTDGAAACGKCRPANHSDSRWCTTPTS